MKPTERQKELYKKLSPIAGIEPKVIKYKDDTGENAIFMMECPDPLDKNVVFYATIGLSDYLLGDKKYELMSSKPRQTSCSCTINLGGRDWV